MLAYVAALLDEVSPAVRRGRFAKARAAGNMLAFHSDYGTPGRDVLVLATGWGAEAAATGTRWLAGEVKPSAVVAVGYSGGTRPGLATGTIVIAEATGALGETGALDPASVITSDRALLGLAHSSAQELRLPTTAGLVGTTPRIVAAASRKSAIGAITKVLAVDLESWHVARATADAGIPFVAVRVIVDTSEEDLPGFVDRLGPGPRPSAAFPVLRYVAGGPGRLGGVVRTGLAARQARSVLARFIEAYTPRWQTSISPAPARPRR